MLRWFSPILVGALLLVGSMAHAQTAKNKAALQAEINSSFPDNTVGQITPAIARAAFSDFLASWQQYTAVNPQVGTTYTLQASDYGQLVTFNNASPVAVTLPNPSTTGFNPWNTYVRNLGAGTVTITPTGANIAGSATLVLTQNQAASIVSDGTNYQTWFNSTATALGCGSLPALTGDVNSSAGSCATSVVSKSILVDAQTGASYVIPPTDNQKLLTGTNGGAQAYSIAQAGGSFPARWQTVACSYGAGTITVTPATSTINGAASLAIPTLGCDLIASDGTNYQALAVGLQATSLADVFSTKGLAVYASAQGFQLNINATDPPSNYSSPVTIINNNPVTHTGVSIAAGAFTTLAPGSSAAGGSADIGLVVTSQQTNYLTTAIAGEHDGAIINTYQGVNSTGNPLQLALTKRANGSSVAAVQSQAIEFSSELVNGSGPGAGTLAIVHAHIGELDPTNTKYGFGSNLEAQVGAWDTAYLVDTFDGSSGTAGAAPSWQYALRVRSARNNANDTFRLTAAGVISLGTWQGTAVAGAFGGTGLSTAAVGDLLFASATTPTWARLADVATGSVLVSGGVNTAPAWSSSPTIGGVLTVNGTVSFGATNAAPGTAMTLTSTDASASSGPDINFFRNSASPAANDTLSQFVFSGKNSSAGTIPYIAISGTLLDPVAGTEDGQLTISGETAGAFAAIMSIVGTGTSILQGTLTVTAGNIIFGTAAKTVVLKQGANGAVGTLTCTSGGTITVSNTFIAAGDAVIVFYESGTSASPAPRGSAKTNGTSFAVVCATGDTAVYNYAIIKNAAWLLDPANDNRPMFMEMAG